MRLDTLDSLDSLDDFPDGSQRAAAESKTDWDVGGYMLDVLDPLESVADQGHLRRNSEKPVVNELDSLDVLDTFPSVKGVAAPLESISQFSSTGKCDSFWGDFQKSRPVISKVVKPSMLDWKNSKPYFVCQFKISSLTELAVIHNLPLIFFVIAHCFPHCCSFWNAITKE